MKKKGASAKSDGDYKKLVEEFEQYLKTKLDKANEKKYADKSAKEFNASYRYQQDRLAAIESAIKRFLGGEELAMIQGLYEQEMIKRILEAREHH